MFIGILAVAKPCGIVVDIKLFNSESKTQVYAHLHQLLTNSSMAKTGNNNSKLNTSIKTTLDHTII